jgi:CRISPR-associated endonuclease/helicase Cas3
MFFAHSVNGQDQSRWQPLAKHLQRVSRLASSRAEKFGAGRLGAVVGLLHDLGKYSRTFQDYISGRGSSPDHATAGACEIQTLVTVAGPDRLAALIGAYCIAGHHSGLPNWHGERALSDRLKKQIPPLDPAWKRELTPEASGLFLKGFKPHPEKSWLAFQLAMFGRMVFSCLVDADYRDTEDFYTRAEGISVDREWAALPAIVDRLIARFDAHMAGIAARAEDTALGRVRADILAHARGKACLPRGVFTLDVPTGGGKTLASFGFVRPRGQHPRLRRPCARYWPAHVP